MRRKYRMKAFIGIGDRICCSVIQSCLTLCSPRDCSMPGFPVLHSLSEFAQIHIHWVCDAIQPSHPLSPFPAFNISQHQCLFQWASSLHHMAKVLELQHQSFQWIFGLISFRVDCFDLLAVQGTLKSQAPQFKSINSLALSFLYSPILWTWLLEKPQLLTTGTFVGKVISAF